MPNEKKAGTGQKIRKGISTPSAINPTSNEGSRINGHVEALGTVPPGKGFNGCDEMVASIRKRERERERERFVNELDLVNGISDQNGPMEVLSRIQCAVAEGLIACVPNPAVVCFYPARLSIFVSNVSREATNRPSCRKTPLRDL